MNNLPEKIILLNKSLKDLEENPSFSACQLTINQVINFLGIDSDNSWKLFVDSNGKIRSNASWFMMADGFADKRASYKIADENDKNIDIKTYWIQKTSKSIISWLVALTPNFEDEPFYKSKNIGIDFIIPEKANRIIVVLSNNYAVRTLELHKNLSLTQQEIFVKWLQDFNFENKAQVHKSLWDSFDLEPVNKTFYKGISSFFVELKQHLVQTKVFDEKNSAFFTNRLIGRIVFCWFLEKKGFINKEQKYFDIENKKATEYYEGKLEKLFFRTLNTEIKKRHEDPFSLIGGLDEKTPFLNGGLFTPKDDDYFGLKKIKFPADYFDRFYTFLNHYNFTTDESTSEFQQVAIDPEMLGRIFENLLAEQTEETGEQARKAKGAFYTPREIVDYMCKESLREYLKSKIKETDDRDQRIGQLLDSKSFEWRDQQRNYRDKLKPYKYEILKALDSLRIIDPACGSGAFPMGMLQLLLQTYERLDVTFDPYKKKFEIIKNNIYGVDIEPIAVEIARLRAWLSIIVEEDLNPKKENMGIEPLPNLDFKFVCANTLIPAPEEKQTDGLNLGFENNNFFTKLEKGAEDFFNISDSREKENKKLEIKDLINKKVNEKLTQIENLGKSNYGEKYSSVIKAKNEKAIAENTRLMSLWKSYLNIFTSDSPVLFFEPKYFFPSVKGGFDIVIGNPPYIKEYTKKSAFEDLKNSPYYQGKMDLWYFFGAMGLDWLKNNGVEAYIAPNNWTTNAGASKFRNKIIDDSIILAFLDFGNYKVFESAGIQTMVYVLKKNSEIKNYPVKYGKLLNDKANKELLEEFINSDFNVRNNNFIKQIIKFDKDKFKDKNVIFLDNDLSEIFKKIKEQVDFYLSEKEVANGIHPHYDYVSKKTQQILGDSYKIGDGIFVLSEAEKNKLNLSEKELELIKPYYTTKQIHKWHGDSKNKEWIIYTDSKFKDPKNIKLYPNIKKHLDKFQKVITSDNRPYGLHRARDEKFFQGEKIIIARKCLEPQFCYTDFDCYVSATFYVIKTKRVDLKCLTALLNSKLIKFWLKNQGKMQGVNYQIDKEPLLNLPLKIINAKQQKLFIKLVNQILGKKKDNPQANTLELEKKIDGMVYKLYNLTREETKIIENN